jgi:hypothetical protein
MSLNELISPVSPLTLVTSTTFEQYVANTYSTSFTVTPASLLNGILTCTAGANVTITLPTATLLLASLPASQQRVGGGISFLLVNGVAFTTTIAAGTGITITGLAVNPVAANTARSLVLVCTSITTPSFALYG